MFLFLSKLLPLFFYPIGLCCLLLVLAFVLLLRRRARLAMIPIGLSLLILCLGGNAGISEGLARSLEFQNLSANLLKADAIVVLGGCTESALPPRPWVEIKEEGDRVLYAAKLYREGRAPRLILSGGRIEWRKGGEPESEDMAVLLETMGVPRSAMLQDPDSLNTRENALNVKRIMDAQGIRQILLVTSAMHMPRSLMIFRKLGVEAIPAPTDFTAFVDAQQDTVEARILDTLPEADQMRRTTRVLKEYMGIFVYWLRGWV
jgi:uncharacterized SAM-binding protein YcdF (DUF218 family)